MNKKILIYWLVIILSANLLVIVQPALAGSLSGETFTELKDQMNTTGQKGFGAAATERSMPELVASIIKAFLGLLGVIFVVLIIYAGYTWMTAQGEEEKINKAKASLRQAVIGLVIIVAAYAITYFVFSNLPRGMGGGPGLTN